jgi:hypothetical protein
MAMSSFGRVAPDAASTGLAAQRRLQRFGEKTGDIRRADRRGMDIVAEFAGCQPALARERQSKKLIRTIFNMRKINRMPLRYAASAP